MPHHEENPNFSAPAETHDFAALLFDMDGTIIDSTDAIVKYWHALGREIGVPGEQILETSHGRRTIDVLGLLAPQKANWDFVCKAEGQVPIQYGKDAVEVPGSRSLLEKLEAAGAPWAIVTSGTRPLVTGWLDVMKLAHPQYLVTAEEVKNGAKRLGLNDGSDAEASSGKKIPPSDVLVLEDAPAGVRAGKAAGYRVVALAITHAIEKLREAGADWIVEDMRSVTLNQYDQKSGKTSIEIRNALIA
ncbi:DL-glycerol-3-phosphatase [Recurvomyces mirabilis]|nr:DL-glycerol-3-phosphatase [Recurvomyces mirabilis]